MKNGIKKLYAVLTVLVLLAVAFYIPSDAAPEIDVSHNASLTLVHVEAGIPIVGETFSLYKIASVDSQGNFTLVEPFDDYNVLPQGDSTEEWRGIAYAFEGYILRDGIAPIATAVTNADGRLTFDAGYPLSTGLYLVGGTQHIQGDYKYISDPFCVTLPVFDDSGEMLLYDVIARPKFASRITLDVPDATVTRRVLKKWVDDGNEEKRPDDISVSLMCNGAVYQTVELNAENNWTYTWTELDSSYRWTVVEEELDKYNVKISLEGITFLITNTYDGGDEPPEETTTDPEETTTEPGETTTEPGETTTEPGETTTEPGETTTEPGETTTEPGETTTEPGETTTEPGETTTEPDETTTEPGETTTEPGETTTEPGETTTEPGETTTEPGETTTEPGETTTEPGETTTEPGETTTEPGETTTTPEESTTAPEESTTASEESTTKTTDDPTTSPEDEPTTEPPEENLPHTGQLWWPVPMLTAVGLSLIILGLLRRRGWEDE